MIEGESGIVTISPPNERPVYRPAKKRLYFPNGAMGYIRSAADPDAVRGLHVDTAWCDEWAKWKYPKLAWDNLMFALRRPLPDGRQPKVCVTTTPRRLEILRQVSARSSTVITTGSTYENYQNLAEVFLDEIIEEYEGTTLGRQEIHAQILKEVEGALWTLKMLEDHRIGSVRKLPEFKRILVAVDPPGTLRAEAGITVGGLGVNSHGYLLDDRSLRGRPREWGEAAVQAFYDWEADAIVGEVNFGADMVENTIAGVDPDVPFIEVRATRGKQVRAEPISNKAEKGRIHHVGTWGKLEDQLTTWTKDDKWSPDRMDSYVWLFTELFGLSLIKREQVTPAEDIHVY